MKTRTAKDSAAARFLAARVAAVRAELSEAQRSEPETRRAAVVRALKRDLGALEARLDAALVGGAS